MDIQEIAAGIGSSQALRDVAGKLGISPEQAQTTLQGVLQHLSSGGQMESMVEGVAAKAGISAATVQQFLPSIMGLLQGHSENASEGVQAALTGVIGSLQGSPIGGLLSGLDANKDGSIVDDAMGMMKGLFGGKPA
ncbi:hypothetical protein [Phenylobacterium sp.]|uniref:hypothetical protein n=1 Tax=Phenylobacterium sp. TaxID=1871053 RepID=UPI0027339537|nr:hypothetical protein [Phenylobacterium sp.]MDP3659462.1 hypothetical protein [Phenylobacterium sp.]